MLEKTRCRFEMYMFRATKQYKLVGEMKPKANALQHFKVEAVQKLDGSVLDLS